MAEPACKRAKLAEESGVPTLLELAATVTAQFVPFQHMEERYNRIPEPVQRRVLFWSFPREEVHIRLYSSPCGDAQTSASSDDSCDHEGSSPFSEGLRLLENGCVEDALQIGFHLSGVVRSLSLVEGERTAFRVSVSFDRCKITAVKCTCDARDIHWCKHVVALSLFRIRHSNRTRLRLPISETLHQMERDQLQKFVQYLIAEHHTEVLPTAQSLADEILQPESTINDISGAPDPTAGPSADSDHSWFLDEAQVCAIVKTYLSQSSNMEQIKSLFAKVKEMLRRKDDNGPRLLRLLTDQFLAFPWLQSLRSSSYTSAAVNFMSEKCQLLWDQLGALWVCVVLNPYCAPGNKARWAELFRTWSAMPTCPTENGAPPSSPLDAIMFGAAHSSSAGGAVDAPRPRTVFQRAADACNVNWTDDHLQCILRRLPLNVAAVASSSSSHQQYTSSGQAIWSEHVPTACARVDSLRANGYRRESLSLAVAIVRSVKVWEERHRHVADESITDGWIGHALDPINCLFDTLLDAAHEALDEAPAAAVDAAVGVDLTIERADAESHLTLAVQFALTALGQRRRIPSCGYVRHKAIKHQESLIDKLKSIVLDDNLFAIIKIKTLQLMESKWSGLYESVSPDTAPVYPLACYLFGVLRSREADLAYQLALRALRTCSLEAESDESGVLFGHHPAAYSTPITSAENQQSQLASTLLLASKDDVWRLRAVLESIHVHMRSSALVYRLAHEVHREATSQPDGSVARKNLLNAAIELGLQVLRMTLGSLSWPRKEMVRWLVALASSLSLDAVLSILRNWHQLFTAVEASGTVAQIIVSEPLVVQLKLDSKQQTELAAAVHGLALQCALKNPQYCALHALNLCESEPKAFDNAYRLVVDAARSNCVPAQELFNIAKHMEHRGYQLKAYEMAVMALRGAQIGYSDESSPLIQDVYWACWLGEGLGSYQLTQVIGYIVKNVKCATVLSAILKGYALGGPSLAALGQPDKRAGVKQAQKRAAAASAAADVKLVAFDKPPLNQLLEAAIGAYVTTAHSRLAHISPRHYGEFLDFLTKARDTFLLAHDGDVHFAQLVDNLKLIYKGKKKLMTLITERFS